MSSNLIARSNFILKILMLRLLAAGKIDLNQSCDGVVPVGWFVFEPPPSLMNPIRKVAAWLHPAPAAASDKSYPPLYDAPGSYVLMR